jgi:hypothetical protein
MVSDMIYIREPLIQYRVHAGNDTALHTRNHIQLIHHYGMLLWFADRAEARGLTDVMARKDAAIQKLGQMCLRYSVSTARSGHFQSARNYLNLALVFDRSLAEDSLYMLLKEHLRKVAEDPGALIGKLAGGDYLVKRTISYAPPEGYVEI